MRELSASQQKLVRSLHRKRRRDEHNLCFIEGPTLCEEALRRSMPLEFAVVDQSGPAAHEDSAIRRALSAASVDVFAAAPNVFARISDTSTPQGILAVMPRPQMQANAAESVIVLDGVADPGNVGTIIRTALWFGFTQILLGPGSADPWGPKALRAGMGATFQTATISTENLPAALATHFDGQRRCGAVLGAKRRLADLEATPPMSIIMGNEAQGISAAVRDLLDESYEIPGAGMLESLNVAAASAVSLYHFSQFT